MGSATGSVWVVIPTYNEIENISNVLDRVRSGMPLADVLVVDDGSPDGTADVVRTRALSDSRLHLLERRGKLGLGTAYIAGFTTAIAGGADVIVQMDADLSHDPVELPMLVAAIAAADLVIGSRYVEGGRIENWPPHRLLLSRTANRYARNVLGLHLWDVTSGYRAWSAQGLASMPLDSVRNSGYAFQAEMAMLASRQNLVIAEHPITFRDRTAGTSKMRLKEILDGVIMLAKVRLSQPRRAEATGALSVPVDTAPVGPS